MRPSNYPAEIYAKNMRDVNLLRSSSREGFLSRDKIIIFGDNEVWIKGEKIVKLPEFFI